MQWWMYVVMLAAGILMILLEILTPHGIAAICGFTVIAISSALCVYHEGWQTGLLYMIVALGLASFCSMHALRTGVKLLALKPVRDPGAPAPPPEKAPATPSLGEQAVVVQPLHPTGTIEWQGRRFAARTLNIEMELGRGETVLIRDRDSIYYLVERAGSDSAG